jgi:hypothetical protein
MGQHGGRRPGAGRPRGSRNKVQTALIEAAVAGNALSPLAYLLAILNDPAADVRRRDACAIAAAPFVHARRSPQPAEDERPITASEEHWRNLLGDNEH